MRKKLTQPRQVSGFADKGKRNEIHSELQPSLDVGDVFGGQRGETDFDAWKIYVATAAELAFGQHLALDLVPAFGEHFHLESAVIDQHDITHFDVVDEIFVIHIHRTLLLAA